MQVHIIDGWSEGPRHMAALEQELSRAGFSLSQDKTKADVIIAHSADWYFLPKDDSSKLIAHINPPYWPNRPILLGMIRNVLLDIPMQLRSWGWKRLAVHRLKNIFYIFIHPLRGLRIWRSLKSALVEKDKNKRVLIMRNKRDCFCSPEIKSYLKSVKGAKIVELPGLHEDCWFNPKPYVDLILKEL